MISFSGREIRGAALRGGLVGGAVSVICVGLMFATVDDVQKASRIAVMNLLILGVTGAGAGVAGRMGASVASDRETQAPSPPIASVSAVKIAEAEADRLRVQSLSEVFGDGE